MVRRICDANDFLSLYGKEWLLYEKGEVQRETEAKAAGRACFEQGNSLRE